MSVSSADGRQSVALGDLDDRLRQLARRLVAGQERAGARP